MRKPNRALRVIGAVAMIVGLLAAMIAPVSAQREAPGAPGGNVAFQASPPNFAAGDNVIYYPWVANDDPTLGLGPADTMISVQNLDDRDAQIWLYVGDGSGGFALADTAFLARYASKTFTAEELGIGSGSGAPVRVVAYHRVPGTLFQDLVEIEILLSRPVGVTSVDAQVSVCVVNLVTVESETAVTYTTPHSFLSTMDIPAYSYIATSGANAGQTVFAGPHEAGVVVFWENQNQLQAILNAVNPGPGGQLNDPFGGLNADGDCLDRETASGDGWDSTAIGGIAKMAVAGESLPFTSEVDTAVSGYNALNGWEVFRFDEWYLPIVQTNCGPGGCWDSVIRVANVGARNNAVTVRFFPSDDGSGSLKEGFQVQTKLHGGGTFNITLSDYVPDGWVGSAHIYSDGAVFAMVDRFKVGYNMWITNTGSSGDYENVAQVESSIGTNNYVLFAPHVLVDYFGWNTGINVANLYDGYNHISIQYFNLFGNATQGASQRLAPHGMTYFYDPSSPPQNNSAQDVETDVNANVVGSALIWSEYPVAAVVDATKYPESDPTGRADLFQATSYSATQNVFTWQAVPYVSKGSPVDGSGATSGINIMNPNPTAATANVYWVNQSGFNAQNFGVSSVTVPAFSNGFVYSLTQQNLPTGFYGAAQVVSNIPVAAVSANVNYDVDGDGSVIFNAFNPCGFYRTTQGDEETAGKLGVDHLVCSYGDPLDITGGSVTKTFVDPMGNPVQGVWFEIVTAGYDSANPEDNNIPFPYQRDGFSGPDGSMTFHNVPVGDYELNVVDVPPGYLMPDNPADVFTLNEGADLQLVNTLMTEVYEFTKFVYLEDTEVGVQYVNILMWPWVGDTLEAMPVVPDVNDLSAWGYTDVDGEFTATLGVGEYVLCMVFPLGIAQYTHPVTGAIISIGVEGTWTIDGSEYICEIIEVVTDEDLNFEVNEIADNIEVFGQIDIQAAVLEDAHGLGPYDVCLHDAVTDVVVDCQSIDPAGITADNQGFYFSDVASGTYYLVATENNANPIVATSDPFDYSIVLDARDGFLDDIATTVETADEGELQEGGEWDFVIGDENSATFIDVQVGPGQTP